MAGQPIRRAREGRPPAAGATGYTRTHPPFEAGNQVARTHGVFAQDVDDEAVEVLGWLFPPEAVRRHPAMAVVGAQIWVRRRRALADIDERGMVLDGDKEHPLLRYVHRWDRQLLDFSHRFGLDPRSEAELAKSQADATHAFADLDAVRASGREVLSARATSEDDSATSLPLLGDDR